VLRWVDIEMDCYPQSDRYCNVSLPHYYVARSGSYFRMTRSLKLVVAFMASLEGLFTTTSWIVSMFHSCLWQVFTNRPECVTSIPVFITIKNPRTQHSVFRNDNRNVCKQDFAKFQHALISFKRFCCCKISMNQKLVLIYLNNSRNTRMA